MAITINGSGTVTGLSVGGLPDGTVDSGTLATDSVTAVKIPDTVESSLKSGRKNLIINGGFDVWQRGTARRYVHTTYTADRWTQGQHQGGGYEKVAVTDTAVPFKSAMRVTSSSTAEASSGTRMALATMLESVDSERYAGKTVTLSFWVRFSAATLTGATGGWYSELSEYDSVDPVLNTTGATRTNSVNIPNGSYPTTWTKYEQTVTCGAGMKNLGARFIFGDLVNTTSNSDFWYEITGVQLELGSVATDFEHRSYGEELALCQRYYWRSEPVFRIPLSTNLNGGNDYNFCYIQHPVEMRVAPAIGYKDGDNNATKFSYHSSSYWSNRINNLSQYHAILSSTGVRLACNPYTGWDAFIKDFTADAEL